MTTPVPTPTPPPRLRPARWRGLALAAAVVACGHPVAVEAQDARPAAASTPSARPGGETHVMRLRLAIGGRTFAATLADNATARDFASLLPLTLTMGDLLRREKYAALPRPLDAGGPRSRGYAVGQIIYWSPGPDVAIYYRQDGSAIPAPGMIVLGTMDAGWDALAAAGSAVVTIDRAR